MTRVKWYHVRAYKKAPAGALREQLADYITRNKMKALIKYLYYSFKYDSVDLMEEFI